MYLVLWKGAQQVRVGGALLVFEFAVLLQLAHLALLLLAELAATAERCEVFQFDALWAVTFLLTPSK